MKPASRRTDAWTTEDDSKLASIVLEHIRRGSTQLRAFEEAARVLGRTSGACGFRWNAVLRKVHCDEVGLTKLERKKFRTKDAHETVHSVTHLTPSSMMRDVMDWLEKYDREFHQLSANLNQLLKERDLLAERVRELETRDRNVNSTAKQQLASDAETLVKIIERAKRLIDVG